MYSTLWRGMAMYGAVWHYMALLWQVLHPLPTIYLDNLSRVPEISQYTQISEMEAAEGLCVPGQEGAKEARKGQKGPKRAKKRRPTCYVYALMYILLLHCTVCMMY